MSTAAVEAQQPSGDRTRLAEPGRNCWRLAWADRLGVVVDGEEYFRALLHCLPRARRSILMLGWEFDSRTRLVRGDEQPPAGLPAAIGPLLNHLARTRPQLDVRVLIWDSALIYAFNREWAGFIKMDWLGHPRLHFCLDDSHPIGASHHQKIVVVDDALAFVGGLDVTSQRWDSRGHHIRDPRRNDPAFPDYPPFHDVMSVVTGEAAAALAELCRQRWRCATGQVLRPPPPGDGEALWPEVLPVLCRRVPVALARTSPPWDGAGDVHEVERLYLDMIASARRLIYVENQYFASRRIAQALGARLAEPDGPEIAIVGPGEPTSIVERSTMGVVRARLHAELMEADRHGRLRLYYPAVGAEDVKVHAKVMIVDDRLLRIGSSNLNNRSMGLDTECDLLLEAAGDPAIEAAIRRQRHDLMAEHLGVGPERVAEMERALGGSMHRVISALGAQAGQGRRLEPLDCREPSEIVQIIAATGLPDPEEPVETMVMIEEAMPGPARRPLNLRVLSLAGLLAGLAVAATLWRFAPFEWWRAALPWLAWLAALKGEPMAILVSIGLFLAGGLARLPPSLLVLATGAAQGMWVGALNSLAGVLASACLLYGLGSLMGRGRVRRMAGWKVHRVNRALTRHGIFAVTLLRLMPVASFGVTNMVAGASRVSLRDFVIGSALGMGPGVFAMSVLGDRVAAVLRNPNLVNIGVLLAGTTMVIAAVLALVNRLGRARSPVERPSGKV